MGITHYFTTVIGYRFDISHFPKKEGTACGCELDEVGLNKKYCSECGKKVAKETYVCLPDVFQYEDGGDLYYISNEIKIRVIIPNCDEDRIAVEVCILGENNEKQRLNFPKKVYFAGWVETITHTNKIKSNTYNEKDLNEKLEDIKKLIDELCVQTVDDAIIKHAKGIFLIAETSY